MSFEAAADYGRFTGAYQRETEMLAVKKIVVYVMKQNGY